MIRYVAFTFAKPHHTLDERMLNDTWYSGIILGVIKCCLAPGSWYLCWEANRFETQSLIKLYDGILHHPEVVPMLASQKF